MQLNQIDQTTLQRYLTYREVIDEDIDFIMGLTSLLSQYQDCGGSHYHLDLNALGIFNAMLNSRVQNILENLENFLPLQEVKGVVCEGEG